MSKPARSSPDAQTDPGAGGQFRGRSSEGSAPAGRGAREGAAGSRGERGSAPGGGAGALWAAAWGPRDAGARAVRALQEPRLP